MTFTNGGAPDFDSVKRALGLDGSLGGTLLSGGVINQNLRVDTNDGSYVVRIYPKGRRERQVRFEVALHQHLQGCGARVPRVVRPAVGASVPQVSGRCAIVLEYLDARPLDFDEGRQLPPDRLAQLLQAVESGLESFKPPFRPIAETRVFETRLGALLAQFTDAPKKRSLLEAMFRSLQAWEETTKIPCRVVHADIHAGNILLERSASLNEGKLWLIDFDDAHVSYRAIDWVLPAIEFSLDRRGTVDEEHYQTLLKVLSKSATAEEVLSFPLLRKMMLLKFAATFATLGHVPQKNPYLLALLREE